MEEEKTLVRNVLIEKVARIFSVEIYNANDCGWWYGCREGEKFLVRNGDRSDYNNRTGYKKHLLDGFYVVMKGKMYGDLISKKHAIKT